MSPFAVLRLPADADERAIKRAYAQLLRQHRPDEDAAAFQRLHEAYTACLAHARMPASPDDGLMVAAPPYATDAPGSVVATAPAAVAPIERPIPKPPHADAPDAADFDAGALIEGLRVQLEHGDAARLRHWLHAQPALYSMAFKDALRPAVVQALDQCPTPIDLDATRILLRFFGLDQVDRDGLAERVQLVLARRERTEALDRAVRRLLVGDALLPERLAMRALAAGTTAARRLWMTLLPGMPRQVRELLDRLRSIDPALHHPGIHMPSAMYWHAVTDLSRISEQRGRMALMRLVCLTVVASAVLGIATDWPLPRLLAVSAGGFLAGALLWVLYAAGYILSGRLIDQGVRRLHLPRLLVLQLALLAVVLPLTWLPFVGPFACIIGLIFVVREMERWLGRAAWPTLAMLGITIVAMFFIDIGIAFERFGIQARIALNVATGLVLLRWQLLRTQQARSALFRWMLPAATAVAIALAWLT